MVCHMDFIVIPGKILRSGSKIYIVKPEISFHCIMFKNILRTFEAEILKIFKNIQPQPKN